MPKRDYKTLINEIFLDAAYGAEWETIVVVSESEFIENLEIMLEKPTLRKRHCRETTATDLANAVCLYYGLGGSESHALEQIGRIVGRSRPVVASRIRKAIRRLRKYQCHWGLVKLRACATKH